MAKTFASKLKEKGYDGTAIQQNIQDFFGSQLSADEIQGIMKSL